MRVFVLQALDQVGELRDDRARSWRSLGSLGVQLALATFGKITNTVNEGRQVQFTLKPTFCHVLRRPRGCISHQFFDV
jgi:hypothetical protein